jgi:hypothetical protein
MWNKALTKTLLAGAASLMLAGLAFAGTPEEAAQLKTTLTPLGAERAGNKEGTIPAWEGGIDPKTVKPFACAPGKFCDSFPDEKPLVSITAKNMDQYADNLTDGVKALLKKHPDSFRVDLYPTHRTAAAPQWVYDNTFLNATRAKLVPGPTGDMPRGAVGGIPFPIPHAGVEVMWNNLLHYQGTGYAWKASNYLTAGGSHTLDETHYMRVQMPYYFKENTPEKFDASGDYWLVRTSATAPSNHTGEGLVGRNNVDRDKEQSYLYLEGQRRTRKLPTSCCDTPVPGIGLLTSFDEVNVWNSRMDRFNWKIVGKKEIIIPYNSNKTWMAPKVTDLLGAHHVNPDYIRWELHRVWVVEATLAPGKSHVMHRSLYYVDEDSWMLMIGDRWDGAGNLARTIWNIPFIVPEIPALWNQTFIGHDLKKDAYVGVNVMGELFELHRFADQIFTGDAMAQESVR